MIKLLKQYKEEIIVVLIFMFFAFGFNVYRVQGDGFLYYVFLEKMLGVSHPESHIRLLEESFFQQAGCVYFNAPFYLFAYTIENMFHFSPNFNGITLRQISINLASNFYMALSLILAIKILKLLNFKHKILPILSILFSTSAFTVAVIQPSWNHSVDVFINSLLVYSFLKSLQEKNNGQSACLGVILTISILVRYFNFLWIIPFLLYYFLIKRFEEMLFFIFGFIGTFWIIPLVLYTFNGTISPFYHTGISMATVDSISTISLMPEYILKYLVHPLRGLFVWSPVAILSALGLIYAPKNKEKLGYLFIGTWGLFLILCGFFPPWNTGWSFSNRYLVNLFPIYIIGLSACLEKYGRKIMVITILLTIYSIFLFFNWYQCIFHPEYETPWYMFKAWKDGLPTNTACLDRKVDFRTFIHRIFETCRYKYLFRMLK